MSVSNAILADAIVSKLTLIDEEDTTILSVNPLVCSSVTLQKTPKSNNDINLKNIARIAKLPYIMSEL